MATWFPENGPRTKVEGFVTDQTEWRKLIGKKIRIRWPDTWGEAFYTGKLSVVAPVIPYEDVPDSLAMTLESDGISVTLVIPTGLEEVEVWTLPLEEGTTWSIP